MSTVGLQNNNDPVLKQLMERKHELDQTISAAEQELQRIDRTVQVYTSGNRKGFALHKLMPKTAASSSSQQKAVKTKSAVSKPRGRRAGNDGSSMDMARQVIRNAGHELSAEEILDAIQRDFGVVPAKSLTQMLYKRARANSSFYRLPDRTYGLLEWRSKSAKKGGRRQAASSGPSKSANGSARVATRAAA